ncbi:MAG TPA: hypothetical protein VD788_03470 [Candidatus Polarisedimenticolaceae bacterium]|nr:hypothetical protein [Candidatus Polarisedimenticolaceae bacterium]
MNRSTRPRLALVALGAALAVGGTRDSTASEPVTAEPARPVFDDAFWRLWGDGRAELAGYELIYDRYGEPRRGTAVTVFVTETFAGPPRVKHERASRPEGHTFPVMKLNLMQDFPTGIYDYHLMTSTFVALGDSAFSRSGAPTKISFSSQEWCGQVYSQLLFDAEEVRYQSHSYFDGEADAADVLDLPADGLAEDALLPWARGMTAPLLQPGESRAVRLLRSLERSRLRHLPSEWLPATLHRSASPEQIRVPAGVFEVDRLDVRIEPPATQATYPPESRRAEPTTRSWTFLVERAPARRVVRWERSDGTTAELLGEARLPYWELNGAGLESEVERLGLTPRPPRTP